MSWPYRTEHQGCPLVLNGPCKMHPLAFPIIGNILWFGTRLPANHKNLVCARSSEYLETWKFTKHQDREVAVGKHSVMGNMGEIRGNSQYEVRLNQSIKNSRLHIPLCITLGRCSSWKCPNTHFARRAQNQYNLLVTEIHVNYAGEAISGNDVSAWILTIAWRPLGNAPTSARFANGQSPKLEQHEQKIKAAAFNL